MANLKTEYTDVKNVKHSVEHLMADGINKADRKQLIDELLTALTKKGGRIPV